MRHLSQSGIDFIKSLEGCRLTAYRDSGGVYTIGYGHIGGVMNGDTISQEGAENLLLSDLCRYEIAVSTAVTSTLNDNEFSALVALCFNIGIHAFSTSTLVLKLNQGDRQGAAEEFKAWDLVDGIINLGLVRRRQREMNLFLEG